MQAQFEVDGEWRPVVHPGHMPEDRFVPEGDIQTCSPYPSKTGGTGHSLLETLELSRV